jgi:MFS superfamily sulfate permease-like transporter
LTIASLLGMMNSFETFLIAVTIAGLLQIVFGIAKLGWLSSFFPSSVLDALLVAIGIILILKQLPHLLGHDTDPDGDMAFLQPDRRTTFTELISLFEGDVHVGAATVGLLTLLTIIGLQYWSRSKKLQLPAMLMGVLVGLLSSLVFNRLGQSWLIEGKHLISLPVFEGELGWGSMLQFPDWTQLSDPLVYFAAGTIAVISSLETLLNLSATDRIDRSDRPSPANRELIAVGIGNTLCGLIGGIPMSAAIERSAVCLQAGSRTKLCAILYGVVLLLAALFFPFVFNAMPLSVLAAVLIVTGAWLARPAVFIRIWQGGRYQFIPFVVTIGAILLSDLLIRGGPGFRRGLYSE